MIISEKKAAIVYLFSCIPPVKNKNPVPNSAGTGYISCGATRLGVNRHPLMHTIICRFFLRSTTSAPILVAFLFALRSPFEAVLSVIFHQTMTLCKRRSVFTYSSSTVSQILSSKRNVCQAGVFLPDFLLQRYSIMLPYYN